MSNSKCGVCGGHKDSSNILQGELVHSPIAEVIRKNHPDWNIKQPICFSCLSHFRAEYIEDILETEKGELTSLEADVVKSLRDQELLSKNINAEFDTKPSAAGMLSDNIARFGGSWKFISTFFLLILVWIGINTFVFVRKPFDPYPFILLNLVLSCVAALQAPIILMSQNRQEAKDRLRSEHDYKINLKAELEIRHLNAKMDQLLTHQWKHLLEIQKIQLEIMEKFSEQRDRKND